MRISRANKVDFTEIRWTFCPRNIDDSSIGLEGSLSLKVKQIQVSRGAENQLSRRMWDVKHTLLLRKKFDQHISGPDLSQT